MRYLIALLFTLNLTSCISNFNETINVKSEIKKAESFLSVNYDSAIFYAKVSLKNSTSDNNRYYSHYILGTSYLKKKQYFESTKNLLTALELIPDDAIFYKDKASILKNLGVISGRFKAYDFAIKYYKQALSFVAEKNKAGILYNLGIIYKYKKEYDESIDLFNEGIELNKKFDNKLRQVKISLQLGLLYAEKDNFEKSESYLNQVISNEKMLENAKYSGKSYHAIANNYIELNDHSTAILYFEKALKKYKSNSDRFVTEMDLGNCYLQIGSVEQALISLENAKKLYLFVSPNPEFSKVFDLLATAYEMKSNNSLTKENLRQYNKELTKFIDQKNELITLLNQNRFEDFINNQTAFKALLTKIFTYKNIILIISVVGLLSFILFLSRQYRLMVIRKDIIRIFKSN